MHAEDAKRNARPIQNALNNHAVASTVVIESDAAVSEWFSAIL